MDMSDTLWLANRQRDRDRLALLDLERKRAALKTGPSYKRGLDLVKSAVAIASADRKRKDKSRWDRIEELNARGKTKLKKFTNDLSRTNYMGMYER